MRAWCGWCQRTEEGEVDEWEKKQMLIQGRINDIIQVSGGL